MTQPKWPSSPIEELDLEIAEKVGRLSDGTATAEDVSEATRLIHERAERMMPSVFRRRKDERKTASAPRRPTLATLTP
jgi:hypothetical protein